ncbi:MAG TPA: hypothetical protein VMW87_00060 [Spirochaetia bacterium]|nr:hypothetical protein [Spirochaetia bacterium]
MKRNVNSNENSFLSKLIRELEGLPRLRSGRESIATESRDLFASSCMQYIKVRYGDYQAGSQAFRDAGIDYHHGPRVRRNADSTHSLIVPFRSGNADISNLEQYFTDDRGDYNSKGYYDTQTAEKFERTVFQLLDEIFGRK